MCLAGRSFRSEASLIGLMAVPIHVIRSVSLSGERLDDDLMRRESGRAHDSSSVDGQGL